MRLMPAALAVVLTLITSPLTAIAQPIKQVEVINFPDPQNVTGSVEVSNLPSIQDVIVTNEPLAVTASAQSRFQLVGFSNNPVTGATAVNLNFVEIRDDLGDLIPQENPPDSRTFLRGDALADGDISIGDALFIAQHLVAPLLRPAGEGVGEVDPVNAGSVNHDAPNDVISLADAVLIAQFLVGNVDEFYDP